MQIFQLSRRKTVKNNNFTMLSLLCLLSPLCLFQISFNFFHLAYFAYLDRAIDVEEQSLIRFKNKEQTQSDVEDNDQNQPRTHSSLSPYLKRRSTIDISPKTFLLKRPTVHEKKEGTLSQTLIVEKQELIIDPKLSEYYINPLLNAINLALHDKLSYQFREHFFTAFDDLRKTEKFPRPTQDEINERAVFLPQSNKRKTLVLDLDETLIHCNTDMDKLCDVTLEIKLDSGEIVDRAQIIIKQIFSKGFGIICRLSYVYLIIKKTNINIRPWAEEFLQAMSEHFEIVIFTASKEVYAKAVLNQLDPDKKYISKRLYRENCISIENVYVKDLRIFKNRSLKDLILVDNCCTSFCKNIGNGVPILSFFSDKKDTQLESLAVFLKSISEVDDVRPFIKNIFKYKEFKYYSSPSELIRQVF